MRNLFNSCLLVSIRGSFLFGFGEAQQQIAVVVVLFFAVGQLGGQLGEGVQNADDFLLDV